MRVRWTRPALGHLAVIQDYIAEDSPIAAYRIVRGIHAEVSRLVDFPAMGRPGRVAGTRELVVNKGRHVVAYRVRGQVVEVIAVIDARRQWPDSF